MSLAEEKKRNNISEYIIHMYQTEDLIRIYEFDMEKVDEYVIKHIPVENKIPLKEWYRDIADKMEKQGIKEKGHLAEVQEIVSELVELKKELLKSDKDFKNIYDKSKSHIEESLKYADGQIENEVQACLNGVYGLLLLRMNGRSVDDDIMVSVNAFGDVLSHLSYKYKQKHFLGDN